MAEQLVRGDELRVAAFHAAVPAHEKGRENVRSDAVLPPGGRGPVSGQVLDPQVPVGEPLRCAGEQLSLPEEAGVLRGGCEDE
nr:hypothetical protein [Rubrobacter aplysinae]